MVEWEHDRPRSKIFKWKKPSAWTTQTVNDDEVPGSSLEYQKEDLNGRYQKRHFQACFVCFLNPTLIDPFWAKVELFESSLLNTKLKQKGEKKSPRGRNVDLVPYLLFEFKCPEALGVSLTYWVLILGVAPPSILSGIWTWMNTIKALHRRRHLRNGHTIKINS